MAKSNPLPHVGTLLRIQRTPQPNILYQAGATVPQRLTLAGFVKYIAIRLSGNLVVATANASAVFAQAPAGLIKRLDFISSDNTLLMSFTGSMLYRLNHFMRQKAQEMVPPVATIGTNPFSATFFLDQESLRMADPSESLFDPGRWKDVFVQITWGLASDIATAGGGGTIAIDATTKASVIVHQVPEGFEQIEFDHFHSYVELPITASNQSLEVDIPGVGSLGGVLIESSRDAGGGLGPVFVDNIINNVTFQSGGTQNHVNKYPWAELQRDNVSDFKLDGAAVLGNQIPGYGYLRLDDNGMFTSAFAIAAMNKPKIILDVTRTSGTEMVRLLWDFYRIHPEARRRMLSGK